MLVTPLKFALMVFYGHGILMKTCHAIVRKRIYGMKLTGFVQDMKKNVFMKEILKNSSRHGNRKAVFVKV